MPIPLSNLLTPYSGGAGGTMMTTLEIYNVVGLVSHRTEKASLPNTVLFYSYSNFLKLWWGKVFQRPKKFGEDRGLKGQ